MTRGPGMPGWPDSMERAGMRKRMDDRLKPNANPELLPGVWWLLAHGFSVSKLYTAKTGDTCEAQVLAKCERRYVSVLVTGSARTSVAWWRARLALYGNEVERALADGLTPYRSRDVAIAVAVQLERLDAALRQYDESKEKKHDNTRKEEAGG